MPQQGGSGKKSKKLGPSRVRYHAEGHRARNKARRVAHDAKPGVPWVFVCKDRQYRRDRDPNVLLRRETRTHA